jgi:glycosyltransferase involved in cell wall biosynthesis
LLRVLDIASPAWPAPFTDEAIAMAKGLERYGAFMTALAPRRDVTHDALAAFGIATAVVPFAQDPSWSSLRAACALVDEHHIDVLHAHGTDAHVLGALVSALTGRRCLASVRRDELNMLELEAYRLHDAMHVGVRSHAAALHAHALGVAPDRLHHLPTGFARPPVDDRFALHRRLGIATSTPIVGWIGRFEDLARVTRFVRAAARVARTHSNAAFAVLGHGSQRERLAETIDALGVADRVHVAGDADDGIRLAGSLRCLVAIPLSNALPFEAVCAMSAGVPVVVTEAAPCVEAVTDEVDGLVVGDDVEAIAAGIVRMLDDDALHSRLAAGARAGAARNHSLDAACASLARTLNAIARSA